MRTRLSGVVGGLALVCLSTQARADLELFYGGDRNNSGNDTPLVVHPNSDSFRTVFLARVPAPFVNDVESAAAGSTAPTLTFGAVTATVAFDTTGQVRDAALAGRYATSGSKYLDVGRNGATRVTITFSEPVSAFGCFVTDFGDGATGLFNGTLTRPGGGTTDIGWVLTVATFPSGGFNFFGVVDDIEPFTAIRMEWGGSGKLDEFGIDDLVVGLADGGGGGGGYTLPPGVEVFESFILPRKVVAKRNAADPSKSTLTVAGTFDTGPDAIDLSAAATLQVGGFSVEAPGFTPVGGGKQFVYQDDRLAFTVRPSRTGSSKAQFKLVLRGDLAGVVDPDESLALRYASAAIDGRGEVVLAGGKYQLGKRRGALVGPDVYSFRMAAKLKGAGKDAFSVSAGIASEGRTPDPKDVTVRFGLFEETVPADAFTVSGDTWKYVGTGGAIGKIVFDWKREVMTVAAKSVTLGDYAEGSVPITLRVLIGGFDRTNAVRGFRKGAVLKY